MNTTVDPPKNASRTEQPHAPFQVKGHDALHMRVRLTSAFLTQAASSCPDDHICRDLIIIATVASTMTGKQYVPSMTAKAFSDPTHHFCFPHGSPAAESPGAGALGPRR
jgi:hypothetical protein